MRTSFVLFINEHANRLQASEPEADVQGCDDCRLAELRLWLDELQSQPHLPRLQQVQG